MHFDRKIPRFGHGWGGRARDLISSARRWTSASVGPLGFSGSGAAKWKCAMTDMETPHDRYGNAT
ncbi:MAG: hypothetical protein IKJ37_03870 [Kiritimatiellae bacterium]|nr:hypothetical protein [Kiritimatiellia bacterium]